MPADLKAVQGLRQRGQGQAHEQRGVQQRRGLAACGSSCGAGSASCCWHRPLEAWVRCGQAQETIHWDLGGMAAEAPSTPDLGQPAMQQ